MTAVWTVGSGDALIATYAASRHLGVAPESALEHAIELAAWSVTNKGVNQVPRDLPLSCK